MSPNFFDDVQITKKKRERIHALVLALWLNISAAMEAAIADDEEDGDIPSSFFAEVTLQQIVGSPGWSIHCEVVATVVDNHPNLVIKLR
jgi:hypothetical protein